MLLDKIPPARRIDIGKRAGVTAGVLGVLCILAELCFMFPHILVSNDARPHYLEHIALLRGVLQIAIIATFVLGAVSVLLIKSKTYGLASIGLAMIATLMGGSKVEAVTRSHAAFSAGLDYFVSSCSSSGCCSFRWSGCGRCTRPEDLPDRLADRPQALLREPRRRPAHRVRDADPGAGRVRLGGPVRLPEDGRVTAAGPPVLRDPAVRRPRELLGASRVPQDSWMWNFHAIHHSSLHMDWLAGSRTHLVDTLVNRLLGFLPIFILGFSPAAIYAYLVFVSFHAVYIHANVRHRWPGRSLDFRHSRVPSLASHVRRGRHRQELRGVPVVHRRRLPHGAHAAYWPKSTAR
jgi:hypothetical protein